MTDVFISYSRRDSAFVKQLHAALKELNRDIWVDWEDIPLSANWWSEICGGIEAADTFLFIISPDSVASPVCNLEVAHALRHHKRLIPIIRLETDEKAAFSKLAATSMDEQTQMTLAGRDLLALARENWGALARHNWLFFANDADFSPNFKKLIEVLDTDLSHVKAHTRLLIRAREWEDKQRDSALLLRGLHLKEAESWLETSRGKNPEPLSLQTEFILASRRESNLRQNGLLAAVSAALVITIALAVISFFLSRQASAGRAVAEDRGTQIAQQVATSDANLYQAHLTQSRFLADLSRQQLEQGFAQDALLLARESLRYRDEGVISAEAISALVAALDAPEQEELYLPQAVSGSWSPDGSLLVTWDLTNAFLWNVETGQQILTMIHDSWEPPIWNGDGSQLLTVTWQTIYLYDIATGEQRVEFFHADGVQGAIWSLDNTKVITWTGNSMTLSTVYLWDAETGELLQEYTLDTLLTNLKEVQWDVDETRLLAIVFSFSENTSQIIDVVTRETFGEFLGTWHPTQPYLLSLGTAEIEVWNVKEKQIMLVIPFEGILDARWSRDGRLIFGRDMDGFVKVWDARNGQELELPVVPVWPFDYTPDKSRKLVTYPDSVRVLNTTFHAEQVYIPFNVASWTQDHSRFIAHEGSTLQIVGADSLEILFSISHDTDAEISHFLLSAAWNQDETRLLTSASDGTARVWDANTGDLLLTLEHAPETFIYGAAWNRDETRILTYSVDGTARVWDSQTGEALLVLQHEGEVLNAFWDAEESRIFALDSLGGIAIWDAQTGERLSQITVPTLINGKLNAEKTRLIVWGSDGSVSVWDTGEMRLLLEVNHNGVETGSAALNHDHQRLLTWGEDGAARVWDTATGEELLLLRHGAGIRVTAAAWNPAETRIVTSATDGDVRVWDAATGALLLVLPP